jgi:O-antigen ligase
VAAVAFAGLALAALGDSKPPAPGADTARLADLGSNRYDYWEVAIGSFAGAPLHGVGTGGFRVEWLRERDIEEVVSDAHSLPLETAAELGVVGLALLVLFAGGVAVSARRLVRRDPATAAGPCAALAAYAVHACVDWHWEMPAFTLLVLALAGLVVARASAGERVEPRRTPARSGGGRRIVVR